MVTDQVSREAIEYVLTRGVVQVEKEVELRYLLSAGKPLRIKLGVDPSHYDLTIGHAVVFRKLRQFQRLGHKAIVVIGDWTARLGDPVGVKMLANLSLLNKSRIMLLPTLSNFSEL